MATNNKPANTLRCGNIKATIWQNVSEKGPFFSTTFSRPFKDQSGAWRNGTSFGLNDLEALVTVARDVGLCRCVSRSNMLKFNQVKLLR
jgi:hypothetical protein